MSSPTVLNVKWKHVATSSNLWNTFYEVARRQCSSHLVSTGVGRPRLGYKTWRCTVEKSNHQFAKFSVSSPTGEKHLSPSYNSLKLSFVLFLPSNNGRSSRPSKPLLSSLPTRPRFHRLRRRRRQQRHVELHIELLLQMVHLHDHARIPPRQRIAT